MKSGHGCLSRKRTRCASTTSTAATCAYRVKKGVMTPGVSAGSNHVGASETWTASVICPSAAPAGGGAAQRARAQVARPRTKATSGRDPPCSTAGGYTRGRGCDRGTTGSVDDRDRLHLHHQVGMGELAHLHR